jgi:hypothetical protein
LVSDHVGGERESFAIRAESPKGMIATITMEQIETAAELWSHVRAGLHIRKTDGRDNQLYDELKIILGCPANRSLKKHLQIAGTTAEQLLISILEVAAPFAQMFHEIWDFLAASFAPNSRESIRIRFGLDANNVDIDLEQFREWSETVDRVMRRSLSGWWDEELYDAYMKVVRLLGWEDGVGFRLEPYHFIAETYELPPMPQIEHEIDKAIGTLRNHLQGLLGRPRDELRKSNLYRWLSDLNPLVSSLLGSLGSVSIEKKDRALAIYRESIAPRLNVLAVNLREPLEILNLPFWKKRWQTYEIWATVATIRALDKYRPEIIVKDGYVAMDGKHNAIVAKLLTPVYQNACIVSQFESLLNDGTAIRPDLSICFDDRRKADSRAAVVEFKQRQKLTLDHVIEVGERYAEGSPSAAGVIVLNYDRVLMPDELDHLPKGVSLFEGVQPKVPETTEFGTAIQQLLVDAGLAPWKDVTVLLDISSSMDDAYSSGEVQQMLRDLVQTPNVSVFAFNDDLVGKSFEIGDELHIETGGGTALAMAIKTLKSKGVMYQELIVISDGEFEEPNVPIRHFEPDEMQLAIEWIRAV